MFNVSAKSYNVIRVEGVLELNKALKQIPLRARKTIMASAYRKAAKPLISAARSNLAGTGYGTLSASIGVIKGKSKKNLTMWVGPLRGKNKKNDGWYGHFVEFGTASVIKPKRKSGKKAVLVFKHPMGYTVFAKQVRGQSAHPYMRPAYEATKQQIVDQIGNEINLQIEKYFSKLKKR